MAVTKKAMEATGVVYELEGTLLEACTCGVLCPCWIGEDPDLGVCDAVIAWHFDRGTIKGIDIGGLTLAGVGHIPGNILEGNWKLALFVDDKASEQQQQALLDVFTGKLGGPIADLAQLIGEVVCVERAPITHELEGGAGTLRVGDFVSADMAPYTGPDGSTTTLNNSVFSTVPGSPAYVSKGGRVEVKLPQYGMEWTAEGRNAIQSDYKITFTAAE